LVTVRARGRIGPGVAFWIVGATFAVVMAFSTVPTPLWPLYQRGRILHGHGDRRLLVLCRRRADRVVPGRARVRLGGSTDCPGARRRPRARLGGALPRLARTVGAADRPDDLRARRRHDDGDGDGLPRRTPRT